MFHRPLIQAFCILTGIASIHCQSEPSAPSTQGEPDPTEISQGPGQHKPGEPHTLPGDLNPGHHPTEPKAKSDQVAPWENAPKQPGVRHDAKAYKYTQTSQMAPLRLGITQDARAHSLLRTYHSDFFDQLGVNVELYTGFRDEPQRLERITRDFDLEFPKADEEGKGVISDMVLVDKVAQGELDGAVVSLSTAIIAHHEKKPVVAVAQTATGSTDAPSMLLMSRTGLDLKDKKDLTGKKIVLDQPGPDDEVFLRALFAAEGLDPQTDLTLPAPGPEQYRLVLAGEADLCMMPTYTAQLYGDKDLIIPVRPLDWVDPSLRASVLLVHSTAIESRSDDIARTIQALTNRIAFEKKQLPASEKQLNRAYGYALEMTWNGATMPQTKLPPTVDRKALDGMQTLLHTHGMIESTVSLDDLVSTAPFLQSISVPTSLPEPAHPEWLPNTQLEHFETIALATARSVPEYQVPGSSPDRFNSALPLFDALMGADHSVTPGLVYRKMNEVGVAMGAVMHHQLDGDTIDRAWQLRQSFPERFANVAPAGSLTPPNQDSNKSRVGLGPLVIRAEARSWPGWNTTPSSAAQRTELLNAAKASNQPVVFRLEGYNAERDGETLKALLKENADVNFIWSHGGMIRPKDAVDLLGRHQNLYVLVSQIKPKLDLPTQKTDELEKLGLFVADRIKQGPLGARKLGRGRIKQNWHGVLQQNFSRFLFASELNSTYAYETRYRSAVIRFRQSLKPLTEATAKAIAYGNALRLYFPDSAEK